MKAYPNAEYSTARNQGSQLLAKQHIKSEIERVEAKKDEIDVGTRTYLLAEAHQAGLDASEDKQHRTRLAAIDIKAKLSGAYNQDAPDLEGYRDLIQSLTINQTTINVSSGETHEDSTGEAIDVTSIDGMDEEYGGA
jgi:hypothetical protein